MKFVPKEADGDVNVPKESHLGEFFKAPIGGEEYQHHRQHELLIRYAEKIRNNT